MHKPEPFQENGMHNISLGFEIQTGHLISLLRQGLELIKKKKEFII